MAKKEKNKEYAEYVLSYCVFTGRKEVVRHQLLNKTENGSKNFQR